MKNKYYLSPIDDIKPNPLNPREHPEEQQAQLAKCMAEVGFTQPVLIDENRVVLAGNGRLAERAKPARLALDHILLDDRLQSRELKPRVVKEYLGALRHGEELPPVRVVRDVDDHYYLVDGHHRIAAIRQLLGVEDIAVEIVEGTFADALWLSWGTNRGHGLRRTQKDKRRAIQAAINHPRWSLESDRAIARHIGCDHKTVASMRREPASGEFPTRWLSLSGPSKSKILRACQLLSRLQPEQARQFDRADIAKVRAGYEPLHRLLFGFSTLQLEKPRGEENRSEAEMNINNQ